MLFVAAPLYFLPFGPNPCVLSRWIGEEMPQIGGTRHDHRASAANILSSIRREMLRRSSARPHTNCVGTTLHEFTGKILCGKCGCKYRRKKLASGKMVWICPTFNRLGKAYCASQQIPDAILRDLVNGIELDHICVPCANTVTIITKSGEEITKTWENPSRSESWTPEMREKARQRSMIHGKKRSNDYSGD